MRYLVDVQDVDVNMERWDGLLPIHLTTDKDAIQYLVEVGSNIYACNSVRLRSSIIQTIDVSLSSSLIERTFAILYRNVKKELSRNSSLYGNYDVI